MFFSFEPFSSILRRGRPTAHKEADESLSAPGGEEGRRRSVRFDCLIAGVSHSEEPGGGDEN